MLRRFIFIPLVVAMLVGCSSTRGGYVDEALDKSLYKADTKAERLLRYFEVQALLVNFAAHAAGNATDRDAIALANAVTSAELIPLINCLANGSSSGTLMDATAVAAAGSSGNAPTLASLFKKLKVDENSDIRTGYCSFFDSRMINYESLLLSLLRQVVQEDVAAANLKSTITGSNILNFAQFVTSITTLASTYFRDERIISAFRADALELQVFIWAGLDHAAVNSATAANHAVENIRPERADIPTLIAAVKAENSGELRPTIKVWHFLEVYGFMLSSCDALNGDAAVKGLTANGKVRCSTNLKPDSP